VTDDGIGGAAAGSGSGLRDLTDRVKALGVRRTASGSSSGFYQSFLVREHDCLDPVAEVELGEYPADVGLDGG
jgi:hypothetical protein